MHNISTPARVSRRALRRILRFHVKDHQLTTSSLKKKKKKKQCRATLRRGHADFSFEVSRSLAACEGAILLVDATQGVQAQTIATFYLALEQGLSIVPAGGFVTLYYISCCHSCLYVDREGRQTSGSSRVVTLVGWLFGWLVTCAAVSLVGRACRRRASCIPRRSYRGCFPSGFRV